MSWLITGIGADEKSAILAGIAGTYATLDYRFALNRNEIETVSSTDKLTFTRTSSGAFVSQSGVLTTAASGIPRFDFNPSTNASLGLLLEQERTNYIRNSNAIGSSSGSPGSAPTNWFLPGSGQGLTQTVVGTGTESGIPYIDIKYAGTSTGAGSLTFHAEQNSIVVASQNETWTFSAYLKLAAGSFAGTTSRSIFVNSYDNTGTFIASSISTSTNFPSAGPTSSDLITQRYFARGTLANASTTRVNGGIFIAYNSGAIIDFTLRIGLPQLETGSSNSSPIATSTIAVTRNADSATIDGTGVITGTYTMVEKPAGCAVVSGGNIVLQTGFTVDRVAVFPATLTAQQISDIRASM